MSSANERLNIGDKVIGDANGEFPTHGVIVDVNEVTVPISPSGIEVLRNYIVKDRKDGDLLWYTGSSNLHLDRH